MSMHCLVLRLEGLLQAYGTRSRFSERDAASHPTKSAVIGLLAAADGHDRAEHRTEGEDFLPLETLAQLRFGVRADRPGVFIQDFHTTGGGHYPLRPRDLITDPRRAARAAPALEDATGNTFTTRVADSVPSWYGSPKNVAPDPTTGALTAGNTRRDPIVSTRWYLADAAFLAAVESPDRALLTHLAQRLDEPRRLLWLGRKGCAPTHPVYQAIRRGDLETVLAAEPLLPRAPQPRCSAWIETTAPEAGARQVNDQPLSFHSRHRAHAPRWEKRITLTPPRKGQS
ncbi:type I-E CRISPR-associated protein Cas5/CasD [Streptomyces sp. N35]|uniref:type I-E CRISPR-associated protein Cas5/CasD n=1 Tax=Streptomyces sp. N35 TaxID=2795730 RepID=UPI0018F3E869|nr:type I-E CRISPR-associated protein Cas5/CasD [Streptomyces sp. N35]